MNDITDQIRPMTLMDVEDVVNVHLSSFTGFFLSFLGPRFLTLYYSGICAESEGIAFVLLNDAGIPSGFVAGTMNPRGFYARLLKRDWWKFAVASLGSVLSKPTVIKRVMRAFLHPSANPVGQEVAGLFSIGVLPGLRGTGAGKQLVQSFLNEAKQRKCKRVFLTTDRDNNEAVNTFYGKIGFSIERQYATPEGRRMNEYWITLNEEVK